MTTPVISQQIPMTAPVSSETVAMAIVMPSKFTLEKTPDPTNDRVKIAEIPNSTIAAICFPGAGQNQNFKKDPITFGYSRKI